MTNREIELKALTVRWDGTLLRIAVKYGNGEVVENVLTTEQAKQVAKVVLERQIKIAEEAFGRNGS